MRLAERGGIGYRVGPLVIQAEFDRPLMHVPAAVAARDPGHPAGSQQHFPACSRQLVGDLRA